MKVGVKMAQYRSKSPYHLTASMETILTILWNSKVPLTQSQIVEEAAKMGNQTFKARSIFSVLNSLLVRELIKEDGFVHAGKTYARTFAPTMTRPEFYAHMINDVLNDKEIAAFKRALKELRKETELVPVE